MTASILIILIVLPSILIETAWTFAESLSRPAIVINQVGYLPNWPKRAFILHNNREPVSQIELVDLSTHKAVAFIDTAASRQDTQTSDFIQTIDFTFFNKEGTYYLKHATIQSYPFRIGREHYAKPLVTLLRSYFLQRCGVALHDRLTGLSHPPCHLHDGQVAHDDAQHPKGTRLRAPGGWHDAGDYGKYIATTAVSIGRLLHLYEGDPERFQTLSLTIPESDNALPDLLDEVKIGLEWMLTMQRDDGAVYRKLSGAVWPPLVPPDQDVQPRFLYGVASPETAKFAAARAMAARVYRPYDVAFAKRCLAAAIRAWQFLDQHPTMEVDWVQGDDSGSGKYLLSDLDPEDTLRHDRDDRLWAAVELFLTTGTLSYHQFIRMHLPSLSYTIFEWKDPAALGMINYLLLSGPQGDSSLKRQIRAKLLQRSALLLRRVASNGYRLANLRFVWGSNKMTAEEGMTLVHAYRLTRNDAYFQAAVDQLDYLLGRNPFNQSFVTGVGTHPVRHTSHIFARATKMDIPGLLVGGPNALAQDGIAPKHRGPLSYIDDARSYATNEYAIDYNASLIALIGVLTATTPHTSDAQ